MYDKIIFLIIAIICYLIGSCPTGLIISKLTKKKDLRNLGSKNIGASNAARILGFKYGLITCFFDLIKGFLSIFIPQNLAQSQHLNNALIPEYYIIFGLCAVLGHMYPIFTNFKGGKSVVTTVGIVGALNIQITILSMLFFLLIFFIFGYSSLASILTIIFMNLALILNKYWLDDWFKHNDINDFSIFIILFISILIIFKHKKNIINLINQKEYKFNFKK